MKLWPKNLSRRGPLNARSPERETNNTVVSRDRHQIRRDRPLSELEEAFVPSELKVLMDGRNLTEEEVMAFLDTVRPDFAEILRGELHRGRRGGRDSLNKAIGRSVLKNAISGLNGTHRLLQMAADGELAVALPVPPHIEHQVLAEIDESLVFAAEDHLPPHLEDAGIEQLDDLLPKDLSRIFSNVKGILAEGQIRNGIVRTRRSIVRLLQGLPESGLTLFIHNMPHRPPHAEFAQVDGSVEVVEVP